MRRFVVVLILTWVAVGCDASSQAPGDRARPPTGKGAGHAAKTAKPAISSSSAASPSSTSAASEKKPSALRPTPAASFFVGPAPMGIELPKRYVDATVQYAVKVPATWALSGQVMAMRKDNTAAVACNRTDHPESYTSAGQGDAFLKHVTWAKIVSLAKRAPLRGKGLRANGAPQVLEVGLGPKYLARAGHATGELFHAAGSDLYWIDIRFRRTDTKGLTPDLWHVYCVFGVKQGADDAVRAETRAIARALAPPMGAKIAEPRMGDD